MSVAWRASRLRELRSERRRAWRWLAIALGAELAATLAVPATRAFDYPRAADSCRSAAVRFLPLRCDGGDGPPVLDAGQGLRAAVLARGDARRALRRHRALARAAARLADGRAARARFVDHRARRRDRRARCAPPAASRGLAGLAGSRRLLARASGARRVAPAGGACRGGRHAVRLCRPAASLRDRGFRGRRASRLPAQRAAGAADGRGRARLAVCAAHALCGADARRLCAPDAAQGQFRRACRPHRLGRLHLRGPPVRAPGDRDGAFGRGPDRTRDALGRGALQRPDPEHRRRDRDRDAGRHGQLRDPDGRAHLRLPGAGHHQPASRGARGIRRPRAAPRIPGA